LLGSDSDRAKRFQDLYRTLLTPVALIVTLSGVFYVNLAALFGKPERLEFFQYVIGASIILLIASGFLDGVAQMYSKHYRRGFSRWAFGLMMFAAFVSSMALVPQLFSGWIPGEDRLVLTWAASIAYLVVGFIFTSGFCLSKL
jgi:uncharacterized membrane protein YjjP (DUF1212 family)